MTGKRNYKDGLWDVDINNNISPSNPKSNHKINDIIHPKINYIIQRDKTKSDLAQYLHACAFSPVISTFQKCIRKGNFISWPGINDLNFEKLIGANESTIKGHLKQERSNLQSTQLKDDHFPTKAKKHSIVSQQLFQRLLMKIKI